MIASVLTAKTCTVRRSSAHGSTRSSTLGVGFAVARNSGTEKSGSITADITSVGRGNPVQTTKLTAKCPCGKTITYDSGQLKTYKSLGFKGFSVQCQCENYHFKLPSKRWEVIKPHWVRDWCSKCKHMRDFRVTPMPPAKPLRQCEGCA